MTRRPARNQSLPAEERQFLKTLPSNVQYHRVKALYQAGWTLRAITEALEPKVTATTIRSWIETNTGTPPIDFFQPVPTPEPSVKPVYTPKKHVSPGISQADQQKMRELSPIARRFRAKMSPLHAAARANDELTAICVRLHANHVPVQELADAIDVTYRAMARRLGK